MESNQAPVTQKLMGLDNSVNTQWVAELPENDNFTVLTGRIGITGNEPFLNVALYINDQDSYLLSGNKKLMDYLTSQPLNKLTLAGEVYNLDKQKWIKVMYVKTK